MIENKIKEKNSIYDVIILGAGAAGLFCGAIAGKRGRKILILDKADKAGKKILISGGGRCNFSNLHVQPKAYLSQNPHFCKSALARYGVDDFLDLMRQHHLTWQEKTLGQLFCEQKSSAVVQMLVHECLENHVAMQFDTEIQSIEKIEKPEKPKNAKSNFQIITNHGIFLTQSLVIATGGPSIPKMGATDFGLQVAKQFKIKNIAFSPALVPFTFSETDLNDILSDLAGVSTLISVSVKTKDIKNSSKNSIRFTENMLITHKGLSGPSMLQISSYWKRGDILTINLLPEFHNDAKLALEWLTDLQEKRSKAELKTILSERLPQRLAQRLCENHLINLPLNQYHEKHLQVIIEKLINWELTPQGTEGMRTAEVCLGGVDTQELSSKTMESLKVPNLYFIGETVDVTGWLGGYNFQWAWASGFCAGEVV